ncbi:AraC family transcriptional regulator [Cardiobacteriaceae bacterium TAE3-ERU3]|nr:AraC family transcriptional regulator [Cardiobacteriaceae bacterium TAE3-ERU3]
MTNQYLNYLYYDSTDWQVEVHGDKAAVMHPKRNGWSGYGDCRLLDNGMMLGRAHITTGSAAQEPPMSMQCHFGLHIICEAGYSLYSNTFAHPLHVHAPQIWQRCGVFEDIAAVWQNNTRNRVLTIDFTPELIERWREDFALPSWLTMPASDNPHLKQHHLPQQQRIMARTAQIIDHPVITLNDKLALESMTLALCNELFTLPEAKHHYPQIDDVIDIIRSEYNQPLTIAILAQRSGINECYLKQQFKARTGKTIAAYIRDLRMKEAMRLLLDENKTLQQTAWYIGYRSPANFSKVFKKTYGIMPTELVQR